MSLATDDWGRVLAARVPPSRIRRGWRWTESMAHIKSILPSELVHDRTAFAMVMDEAFEHGLRLRDNGMLSRTWDRDDQTLTEFRCNVERLVAGATIITVITPTRLESDRLPWLIELNAMVSPHAQHVIVIDGVNDPVPSELDATIVRLPQPSGAAAARNIGLLHAQGAYVTSADDDDVVYADGLHSRAQALDDDPTLDWSAGYLTDLDADGQPFKTWTNICPPGRLDPRSAMSYWASPYSEFPLAPTTLMVRKTALRAVGGWGGLPQAEDFAMVANVTDRYSGVLLDEVVYGYRKHPGQMMASQDFNHLEDACRRFVFDMVTDHG